MFHLVGFAVYNWLALYVLHLGVGLLKLSEFFIQEVYELVRLGFRRVVRLQLQEFLCLARILSDFLIAHVGAHFV